MSGDLELVAIPRWVVRMVMPWADEQASWGDKDEREAVEILRDAAAAPPVAVPDEHGGAT